MGIASSLPWLAKASTAARSWAGARSWEFDEISLDRLDSGGNDSLKQLVQADSKLLDVTPGTCANSRAGVAGYRPHALA